MTKSLLPLSLDAHPSAFVPVAESRQGRGGKGMGAGSCRFCGLAVTEWQEPCLVSADQEASGPGPFVPACVLCRLAHSLNRPAIEEEVLVIYLPEMSQAAVNVIAREIHLVFYRLAEALPVGQRSWVETRGELRGAFAAFKALEGRAAAARARIGTASPRDLWAALIDLRLRPSGVRWDAGGLRLLPLGRYFRGGRDIYPDLLEALARGAGEADPKGNGVDVG